jgi:hypothetical protein
VTYIGGLQSSDFAVYEDGVKQDVRFFESTALNNAVDIYSTGYIPANGRPDRRFRRVIVQVVTRPELRPRARLGFTADGAAIAARPTQAPPVVR